MITKTRENKNARDLHLGHFFVELRSEFNAAGY